MLLALGLGWSLYRFVEADAISLDPIPPPRPAIVPRADWGARPLDWNAPEETGPFDALSNLEGVLVYPPELRGVLTTIVVHHSAFGTSEPAAIQDLHMDARGFADIAYHYVIGLDGTIYEGREIHVRGAHVQGYNTGSLGIVLIGNFNEGEPSAAQVESLSGLVDYLRYTYGIRYLAGHKDYPEQSPDGTLCPGEHLYALLPGLARELGMRYGIDGYVKPIWVE
jgi:hypothetical protein